MESLNGGAGYGLCSISFFKDSFFDVDNFLIFKNFIIIILEFILFIFGLIGSSWLRAGFL